MQIGYAGAYSFKYSPRPGTPAADMRETVSAAAMDERLVRLQELIDSQQSAFNKAMIGNTVDVLFERAARNPGQIVGRTAYLQPAHVMASSDIIGKVLPVTIASLERYSLLGELAEAPARAAPAIQGHDLAQGDVEGAIRAVIAQGSLFEFDPKAAKNAFETINLRKRPVRARTAAQDSYIRALKRHAMVFGVGPAGTGKTWLAVAHAAQLFERKEVDRIILSRPAVEAGERLGFLPGDLREKVDPYLRPIFDALNDMMPADQLAKRLGNGEIEVAPIAFMRGRTLAQAFVILDEAQNTTPVQMKMFLTRLGEGSRMIITGDPSQVDLPNGQTSGLTEAVRLLTDVEGIGVVRFTDKDVVRHPLVARIVHAYEARDRVARGDEEAPAEGTAGPAR